MHPERLLQWLHSLLIGIPKLLDLSLNVDFSFDLDKRCRLYFTNNLTESKINVISDVIRKSQDTNNINFTYPFTNTNWTNDNLINLFQNKFDTKDTLFFNSKRNINKR